MATSKSSSPNPPHGVGSVSSVSLPTLTLSSAPAPNGTPLTNMTSTPPTGARERKRPHDHAADRCHTPQLRRVVVLPDLAALHAPRGAVASHHQHFAARKPDAWPA